MILLSDIFPLVVWSRSLCSSSPVSLMNTHINVPGAAEEIIGSSLGSSVTHVPFICMAQAVALLFFYCDSVAQVCPIYLVTNSEIISVSLGYVSVFNTISLTAVTLVFSHQEAAEAGILYLLYFLL